MCSVAQKHQNRNFRAADVQLAVERAWRHVLSLHSKLAGRLRARAPCPVSWRVFVSVSVCCARVHVRAHVWMCARAPYAPYARYARVRVCADTLAHPRARPRSDPKCISSPYPQP